MYTYVLCPSPSFYAVNWHHSRAGFRTFHISAAITDYAARSRKSWSLAAEGQCPCSVRSSGVNKANTLARRLAENESRLPLERRAQACATSHRYTVDLQKDTIFNSSSTGAVQDFLQGGGGAIRQGRGHPCRIAEVRCQGN